MQVISRHDAKLAGKTRYFTGEPCKRGHLSERTVSGSACVECKKAIDSAWKKKHVEVCSAQRRSYDARNREKVRAYKNKWNAKHDKEAQKARSRKWYEKNKEKSFENHRKWAAKNPATTNAAAARRRAKVLKCTPKWADMDKIKSFYQMAKELSEKTGLDYHVDHQIPLQGKLVSGLHVQNNLQIMVGHLNQSKGNRYDLHI